jgi:hypothetical protein
MCRCYKVQLANNATVPDTDCCAALCCVTCHVFLCRTCMSCGGNVQQCSFDSLWLSMPLTMSSMCVCVCVSHAQVLQASAGQQRHSATQRLLCCALLCCCVNLMCSCVCHVLQVLQASAGQQCHSPTVPDTDCCAALCCAVLSCFYPANSHPQVLQAAAGQQRHRARH